MEAGRADSITEEKLRVLYRHGVSRISVNPLRQPGSPLNSKGMHRQAVRPHRPNRFDSVPDIFFRLSGQAQNDIHINIEDRGNDRKKTCIIR